jgi:hypothetical protein
MDGELGQAGDGNKALKVAGIVLASFFVLGLVCCGGAWFLTERLVKEIGEVAGATVQGSGVPAVQERLVRDFTGIETDGLIDVDVSIGEDWSVMVRADDNVLALISTEVRGDTLVFSSRGSFNAETDIHATVVMPDLDHVTASGLGSVKVEGLRGTTFTVEIHGSGDVIADGEVDAVDVTISGMGDAEFFGLVAKTVKADISGMGDAEVHATDSLDARVMGMGDVTYRGNPPTVVKEIDGMGDVEPAK